MSLRGIQIARIFIGFLVSLPLLVVAYIWHEVNAFYHPGTYELAKYWLSSAPPILAAIIVGAFTAFFRFRSAPAGKAAVAVGLVFLLIVGTMAWSAVS